ncbi:MAG: autotransporter-associated beta strand repeat-containing protein, partial [Verrucomicrobiota bacterium]
VTGFPGSLTAGVAGSVTVMAQAANGNIITTYTGTVHFTSSDLQAGLPVDYTFVPGDNGIHTFTSDVTLKTAGTQSITATDTVTAITGTQSGMTVGCAAATILTASGFPSPEWVGTAGSVTLSAHDAYGNIATGYTGTVHFTSSDLAATLPFNYTFVSADNGVHNFSGGVTFAAAGTQSISATDIVTDTITGTQSGITVNLVPSIFTWKTATSGSWSDVANWTNDAGVVAGLEIGGKANYTLNFNIAGTYTATHNLSHGFLLNQINLTGATVAGNNLTLANNNTALPQINQSSTASGTINNNLALAADTTVGVTGSGGLTLNGAISGSGGVTKTGVGTLIINAANSYSGPTIISGGQLTMNQVNTALGIGPVTLENNSTLWLEKVNVANNLTINGGTIYAGNGFGDSWNGAVTLHANATVNTPFSMAFGGIVSGTGGFIKTGLAMLSITAANTYTGVMAVQAGTLSVASLNSVSGGTPSSNLGAPTTVAEGTILLGTGANAATLIYHGTGETSDRVLDLAGTTGGATLDQSGASGLLKFTSAFAVTGAGIALFFRLFGRFVQRR